MENIISNYPFFLERRFLSEEKKDIVANLVAGYVYPHGNCKNQMKLLVYRIWNAIKAIFCRSDWQRAMSIVRAELDLLSERDSEELTNRVAILILNGMLTRIHEASVLQQSRCYPMTFTTQ